MRPKHLQGSLFCRALSVALVLAPASHGTDNAPEVPPAAPAFYDQQRVDVNRWSVEITNDGAFMRDRAAQAPGGLFPKEEDHTVVWAAGFQFGTLWQGEAHVSRAVYESDFRPGRILNSGLPPEQLIPDDPDTPEYRVYLCEKGGGDCSWEGVIGAPMRDGQPQVLSDRDSWCVYNDLPDSSAGDEGPPLGIEVHQWTQCWTGEREDVYYARFRVINNTNRDYPDSYIQFWFDPDVGNAGNDLSGYDFARAMGYEYNQDEWAESLNTAFGVVLLQGPLVPYAGNTVIRRDHKLFNRPPDYQPIPGDEQLHDHLVSPPCSFTDPVQGMHPQDDSQYYYTMQGLWLNGEERSPERAINGFDWPGDPVAGTGLLDEHAYGYMLLATGPFTLAPGDTQSVAIACIGAHVSDSADPLDAIVALRETADRVRAFYPVWDPLYTGIDESSPIPPAGAPAVRLGQNTPNPFNPSTRIDFEINPPARAIELSIFDLAGQRVRTLVAGVRAGGEHSARWDGASDEGTPVASGIYFCRLKHAGGEETRKMLLVR